MKTTVEIADGLLSEARKIASQEGISLRALIERGLHQVVREHSRRGSQFKLRRASFSGSGLQAGFEDATWDRLRDAIYRERGG